MYSLVHRLLIWITVAFAAAALMLIGVFTAISMISFQKAGMITAVEKMPVAVFSERERVGIAAPDIKTLLAPIPYQSSAAIFDILPRDRFRRTIGSGYGNCSNLSFGMAYLLLQRGYSFQIVHLIPFQGFLSGSGHTLLNMPYRLDGSPRVGMVDVMEGGLPMSDGHYLDLPTLQRKHLNDVTIFALNARKDDRSDYYGEFLDNAAVGIVKQEEIARYFAFVDRIYFPIGNKRLERIVFSGIAMVFGNFPHTYVTTQDYNKLFADKSYLPWMAQLLLWVLRILPCLLIILLVDKFLSNKREMAALLRLRNLIQHFFATRRSARNTNS